MRKDSECFCPLPCIVLSRHTWTGPRLSLEEGEQIPTRAAAEFFPLFLPSRPRFGREERRSGRCLITGRLGPPWTSIDREKQHASWRRVFLSATV